MADSTPILVDVDEDTAHIDTDNDEFEAQTSLPVIQASASADFKRLIRVLTIITLIFSAVTIALLIATYIIIRYAPFGYYIQWSAEEATRILGKFMFVSLTFSVIIVLVNHVNFVNFPILRNMDIIVDVVLAAGIITWVFRLLDAFPDSNWCGPGYPRPGMPNPPQPHPKCEDWKFVVQILMGIAAGFGGIVGVIYLGLLVLRSIAIFRTKFWKRFPTLTFPTGEISFEISIKLLKRQSIATGNVQSAGQTAEAGSGSGHGPLHL